MHPLGVQPLGNAFLSGLPSNRDAGLGDLHAFSDTALLAILESLDVYSLANLAVTSPVLRCFAYFEDLWKRHVIETWNGNFKFLHCWRCTYAAQLDKAPYHGNLPPIVNLYSDLLCQPWRCARMSLPESWLETDNIPRRSRVSLTDFRRDYESTNRPVILTGCMGEWSAQRLWTGEYLTEQLSGKMVNVGSYSMKFEDYLMYCASQEDDMPLYLFDKDVFDFSLKLSQQFEIPEVFSEDLFSCLEHRPNYRWLIMGPKRSGSTFHKDPNGTSAWNAVIKGSKKWILFPPSMLPPGVYQSPDGSEVATSISLVEWFLNFYEEAQSHPVMRPSPEETPTVAGWWHMAMNLEETIAITQNFVSRITLPHVLQFLKSGNEQLVSGIPLERRWLCAVAFLFARDCNVREQFYDEFVEALRQSHPEILQTALNTISPKRMTAASIFASSVPTSTAKRHKQRDVSENQTFKFRFF